MAHSKTIDYAFVFQEDHLLLDDGSHLLSAGDVVVQRVTRHAWRNPAKPTNSICVNRSKRRYRLTFD